MEGKYLNFSLNTINPAFVILLFEISNKLRNFNSLDITEKHNAIKISVNLLSIIIIIRL